MDMLNYSEITEIYGKKDSIRELYKTQNKRLVNLYVRTLSQSFSIKNSTAHIQRGESVLGWIIVDQLVPFGCL